MEPWRFWVLKGPNVWSACPVMEVGLDLHGWGADQPRQQSAEAVARLRTWLPSLDAELQSIAPPVDLVHILPHLVIHLQVLAGNPVQFRSLRSADRPEKGDCPPPKGDRPLFRGGHCYRLAFAYQEEPVGRACFHSSLALCQAAWEGRPFAVADELARLRDLAGEQRLGPSTLAVVEAARAREIPVDHFNPESGRYLILGQGARQRRSLGAETDDISALARSVTTDKHLTKLLLREAGIPVPQGRPVSDAEDAWKAACELGLPVVVKPQDRDLALGVRVHLRTREQVHAAYAAARAKSPYVLVERFLPGTEHRVLVVGDRVAAVARIEPPHVVGDGISPISELIEAVNRDPRRGNTYPAPLRRLKLDAVAIELLASQGFTLDSLPQRGVWILLRRDPPHLDNGGYLCDVTEDIHPDTAATAVAAAQALRVRVAGIDLVVSDISKPLEEQGGGVVEVNTGPGLDLHTAPWNDRPRPVGAAIIASLFPSGSDGRIPIVAISGRSAAAAGRCLSSLLADTGQRVGRVSHDGAFIAGRKLNLQGMTTFEQTRAALRNPLVDVAVLECDARALLNEGFACDRCDVALFTDVDKVDDPRDPAETAGEGCAEEAAEAWIALWHALAPNGKAVLNAKDPPCLDSLLPPADRLIWFASNGSNVQLARHRAAGGTAVFWSGDALVLARGAEEERLPFGGLLAVSPADNGCHDSHEQLALLAALAGAMVLNPSGDEKTSPPAPMPAPVESNFAEVQPPWTDLDRQRLAE